MRNNTLKTLCRIMCIVMLAGFVLEAPLMAANAAINVNVGGQTMQVTPGQWVSVQNGPSTVHYNVRYVNGQPVALELSQYMKLVLNGTNAAGTAGSTAQATTAATSASTGSTGSSVSSSQAPTPATSVAGNSAAGTQTGQAAQGAQTGQVSQSNQAVTVPSANPADSAVSGTKTSGSWIKGELNEYGTKIKDSFSSGKESGQNFGTKTVDGVKSGAEAVGNTVKSTGSKIGDMLRGAKDRIANIFKRPTAKTDASQSGQSGQSSEQSGQTGQSSEQSGQSGQAGEQSGQSGQSGQVEDGVDGVQASQQAKADKPGFKEVTSSKFKSGYETGKQMTNQGFDNVKSSLKSGFSPKNILMTAGITVGVDLGMQIMRGEKPSLGKALRTVASAEFAGGVVGSVTGAAAGSFFVPFLSAVPVVGGVLSALAPAFGSIVGGSMGAYLAGDLKNGRFSIREAFKRIDWVGVAGQTVGSVAGSMLGSMIFPPFGTIIGGIAGGMLGNWAAHKLANLFGGGKLFGGTGFGSIGMPVGTNPLGTAQTGSVTIGGVAGGSEIPVAGDQAAAPSVEISGSAAEPIGTYASEVQLAYAKYQELYRLYNEMVAQGRQADALKVASEMNKAKAEYETLKAQASK